MKRAVNVLRRIGCVAGAAVLFAVQGISAAADGLFPGGGQGPQTSTGYSMDGLWMYTDYGTGEVSVMLQDKTVVNAEVPESIDGHTINMIDAECFADAEALESVTLPSTIRYIEDFAFYNCPKLTSVSIPDGVETLKYQAFYGCASLTEITVPATVQTIEEFVFSGCAAMEAIHVSNANEHYKDVDGVLYNIDGTTLICYPAGKQDESFTVPAGCNRVEDWAFIGNTFLKEVNIDTITELGREVFYYCTGITSMRIPEGITELSGSVFGSCTALTEVSLPSTLEVIGDNCFYNCVQLASITIPDKVHSIGANAFLNCGSLKEIKLTETVTMVGSLALGFYYDENEQLQRLPNFTIDAKDGTAGFSYALENEIKCTGGVTQSVVFIYVMIGVVVLVIGCTIAIIIVQRRINKRYELR